MKKLLLLLMIPLLLNSCLPSDVKVHEVKQTKDAIKFVDGGYCGVYEFKYKNHSYIQFGSGDAKSIVHNPDCVYCLK